MLVCRVLVTELLPWLVIRGLFLLAVSCPFLVARMYLALYRQPLAVSASSRQLTVHAYYFESIGLRMSYPPHQVR